MQQTIKYYAYIYHTLVFVCLEKIVPTLKTKPTFDFWTSLYQISPVKYIVSEILLVVYRKGEKRKYISGLFINLEK